MSAAPKWELTKRLAEVKDSGMCSPANGVGGGTLCRHLAIAETAQETFYRNFAMGNPTPQPGLVGVRETKLGVVPAVFDRLTGEQIIFPSVPFRPTASITTIAQLRENRERKASRRAVL